MTDATTLDQARYIFTTIKMIRDRIFRSQTAHLESCNHHGVFKELSVTQLYVIMVIRLRREVFMSKLADLLGVAPSSASAMVDRLVDKGVLIRRHSVKDRRKVIVKVSPEISEDIEAVEESVLRIMVELVEKIGPETTRKWCEVLEHVESVVANEM
jgi:DNA-binding MarR family transcriptional regulator